MDGQKYGRRWWVEQVAAFVVLSLMVVGAVIAVDVYPWKPSDVGWLLVGLVALGVLNLWTMLEGIPALGWIVMLTGSILWVKIDATRDALEKRLKGIQEELTEI